MDQEEGKYNQQVREEQEGWIGRGALISLSSILVPGRPTLHLLSPCASHQKGIYRATWLRALSLANVIICASGVRQNWPRINKQEGRRTVNKQHIRRQSTPAKWNLNGDGEMDTHTLLHRQIQAVSATIKLGHESAQGRRPTFTSHQLQMLQHRFSSCRKKLCHLKPQPKEVKKTPKIKQTNKQKL